MSNLEEALQSAKYTKKVNIGSGIIDSVADMFRELFPDKKAVIVADTSTWQVAGISVQEALDKAGIPSYRAFIFDANGFYAEWTYYLQLKDYLKDIDAIAIAVGSGVINDLCKYASCQLSRRYMYVGTAVSMDGLISYGASITRNGLKQHFKCAAPLGFIMDTRIAAAAPYRLTASGYADLLAKVTAGADWLLAHAACGDNVDPAAWEIVQDGLKDILKDPVLIRRGNYEKIGSLTTGLIKSGIAMQMILSSRPSSGAEHQFSHIWEAEGLRYQGRPVSHGFKVGIGTLMSTAAYEFILSKDIVHFETLAATNSWMEWQDMEAYIKKAFAGTPAHIERVLSESRGKYVNKDGIYAQTEALKHAWPTLSAQIMEQIMSFDEVHENLSKAGAPCEPELIGVSRSHLKETLLLVPFMRNRYTIIDMIYRFGLMNEFCNFLFGKGGRWEI